MDIIAGILSLDPISPPRTSNPHQIICPIRIASNPFLKPKGAIRPPVNISAMETAAPNHNVIKLKVFKLFFPTLFI